MVSRAFPRSASSTQPCPRATAWRLGFGQGQVAQPCPVASSEPSATAHWVEAGGERGSWRELSGAC